MTRPLGEIFEDMWDGGYTDALGGPGYAGLAAIRDAAICATILPHEVGTAFNLYPPMRGFSENMKMNAIVELSAMVARASKSILAIAPEQKGAN